MYATENRDALRRYFDGTAVQKVWKMEEWLRGNARQGSRRNEKKG